MGRKYTDKQLEKIKKLITDPEELEIVLDSDDPVRWGEKHFYDPDNGEELLKVKECFYPVLRSSAKDRAIRSGRQLGKTVHLCLDIFHTAFFNKNFTVLIFVPQKKNMNRMLEIMGNMLRKSDLKDAFMMGKGKKDPDKKGEVEAEFDYEIRCASGSVIRFFFMASNADKARGQSTRGRGILYIDEAEYLPEKAYDVIAGFPKSDPSVAIWASSTPSGLPNTWFRTFSDNCAKETNTRGDEFWLPSTLEKNWPEIEQRLRAIIFDEVTWNLEVLAIWADAIGAVYKKDIIDQAIERSKLYDTYITMEELRSTLEYEKADKFLGVDWNVPQNGVRLVEVSNMYGRYYVTRNEKISHESYTQTYTVKRILELYTEQTYRYISVDAGYGETQIELLHDNLVRMELDPAKVLNIVDSVKKIKKEIIYTSPITGARKKDTIDIRVRNYIVNVVGKYMEDRLALPKEEDDNRTGLVAEIRSFRRKTSNKEFGGFEYSSQTHSLSALQICVHGIDKWYEENKKPVNESAPIAPPVSLKNMLGNRSIETAIISTAIAERTLSHSRTGGLGGRSRRSIL